MGGTAGRLQGRGVREAGEKRPEARFLRCPEPGKMLRKICSIS